VAGRLDRQLVAACLALGMTGLAGLAERAAASTPLGTTVTFTGQSSAAEVVDGVTTFSASMTWRESGSVYARDDLVPEGFHLAFGTVSGSGSASIPAPPSNPLGAACTGGPVGPAPVYRRFAPVEVTSPHRPSGVYVAPEGIGRVRAYDSIGVKTYLPSGELDDISGQTSPGLGQPFEFCHEASPIPPWPVYAHFTTRKGVYRYATAFVDQTGDCQSAADAGTHFTTTWTGRLVLQLGRRTVGRLELPVGRTTLIEPPHGRTVKQIGEYDPVGVYRPHAGAVNGLTC
jgi:hypothetical protein